MVTYNSALLAICFMVLLGFMDDVLDVRFDARRRQGALGLGLGLGKG